jgi:hypothetical protein
MLLGVLGGVGGGVLGAFVVGEKEKVQIYRCQQPFDWEINSKGLGHPHFFILRPPIVIN